MTATSETLEQLSVIAVTNRCDQRCVFCLDRDIQGDFDYSTEQALDVIREQARQGSRQVLFMGGEPSRRKDFLVLLDECRRVGLKVMMATNGRSFADRAYAAELLEHGVAILGFSLHSRDEQVANYISGNPHTWADQRQSLQNINDLGPEYGVEVIFKMVVNRYNAHDLKGLVAYGLGAIPRVQCKSVQFKLLREHIFHEPVPFPFGLELGRLAPALDEAFAWLEAEGLRYETAEIPLCYLAGREHRSRELVDLVRNLKYVGWEVREGAYDHGIIYPGYEKVRGCSDCSLDAICSGVWHNHTVVFGEGSVVPQKRPALDVLVDAIRHDDHLRRAVTSRRGVAVAADGTVSSSDIAGLAQALIEEQVAWRERRRQELQDHPSDTTASAAEKTERLERWRASWKRLGGLLAGLAPEVRFETPLAKGWFLADCAAEATGAVVFTFSNRTVTVRVRLLPPETRRAVHVRTPRYAATYEVEGRLDEAQRALAHEVVTRFLAACDAHQFDPFAGAGADPTPPPSVARAQAPRDRA